MQFNACKAADIKALSHCNKVVNKVINFAIVHHMGDGPAIRIRPI